jgi:hypothetical protein
MASKAKDETTDAVDEPEIATETPEATPAPAVETSEAPAPQEVPEATPEPPVTPAPDVPSGTAYLDHDDPNASASYFGADIVRDAEGLFLVPLHAVEHLLSHGFRLIR